MKKSLRRIFSLAIVTTMLGSMAFAAESEIEPYMTYRDNAVVLTASSGISIQSGSFEIKDFKITDGQDPDGLNAVGQTHVLENGQFVFEVGRSGSEAVAAWFNERFSGYNNPSVNGDRTTFDHTAGKLNFAFVGDLDLAVTTPEYPAGLLVTFPDVAFAQGSTLFSNNWWFGQLTGQHTRDSDGPNTMLTFGTTAAGDPVYASFLRGDNDVNEVSLVNLMVVDDANDMARSLANVQSAFAALPIDGTQMNLEGFPGSYDPTVNHIQGYAQYDNGEEYSILSHSVGTAAYAHIIAGPKNTSEKLGYKTYLENWRHPGGIQVIGDYLLVPNEQEASAHVAMYDLRSLEVGELRRVEPFDLAVDHKAGALAITTYEDASGVEYYLLVIAHLNGVDTVYHVYRSEAADGLENADFAEVGSFGFDKDFQGFGLVTEAGTNDIYMIGLWSPTEGATYADFAYLYKLDTENWTIGPELNQIHMISHGGVAGVMGVHFRYGANVMVDENGTLILSATERNSVLGSSLATNDWVSAN